MNLGYWKQANLLKTVWINIKIFPLKTAIKMPLLIGRRSSIKLCRGSISIEGKIKPGMIAFGVGGSPDMVRYESLKNVLWVKNGGKLIFKGKAHFATHTNILASGSTIVFGKNFGSNVGCRFSSVAGITFGDDCLLGGACVIRDSDGHKVFDCDDNFVKTHEHSHCKPVSIGDHVWMANNSSVLKGVSIESNNVIAYGSVVVKSIDGSYSIIGGYPAKVVKKNIIWKH